MAWALGAALLLGLGCATPAARYDAVATDHGLVRRLVSGNGFELFVYERAVRRRGARLHVYIEGDGLPRRAIQFTPPDPTPAHALMPRLIALDPAPAIVLGRPCHHGLATCDVESFTTARYGERAVSQMAQALRLRLESLARSQVVLIGFSGGGAIAVLLAEQIPETVAVVTLAGNLDVAAWTRHHGYKPLLESLDPATRPALPSMIAQLHLRAERDRVVPPHLVDHVLARLPPAAGPIVPKVDHDCCWEDVWPDVLARLANLLEL